MLIFLSQLETTCWRLDRNGLYTVHSLYNFLNSGGIHYSLCRYVWVLKIPLKVKLFL
jgi:hypothetical protein